MNGEQVIKALGAYHDGQLNAASADAVSRHLADCPACRARLDQIGRVDAAVTASAERSAGRFDAAQMIARLADRIDAPPASRPRRAAAWLARPWNLLVLGSAAALLVTAALTVTLLVSRPAEKPMAAGTMGDSAEAPVNPAIYRPEPMADWMSQRSLADLPVRPDSEPADLPRPPVGPFYAEPAPWKPRPPVTSAAADSAGPAVLPQPTPPSTRPDAPLAPTPADSQLQIAAAALPAFAPATPERAAEFNQLLRQVEVTLLRASTLTPGRSRQWRQLADQIREDDLVYRCRRSRQALPEESELSKALATAEALLIRAELAGTWVNESAAVQKAIEESNIIQRCRELRAQT